MKIDMNWFFYIKNYMTISQLGHAVMVNDNLCFEYVLGDKDDNIIANHYTKIKYRKNKLLKTFVYLKLFFIGLYKIKIF